ncbi:MAG TPA: VIT1/CCC1 transporter family protein [Anaerolineales bacterium]|jgi:VIT1/CCC1 family predicted Fe2+/Mn2+ transporter|nr:VIT1/CCC1 transporter family protein [Anaerolineales bacterium]
MPQTPHVEKHFTASETVRDIVIGMSDGLTVPFALAAGLSAVANSNVVVLAGLAEIAAGSIAMGLGGYLAARSDAEHYENEVAREHDEIITKKDFEIRETEEILTTYGLTKKESKPIVEALMRRPKDWVDFMMRFELGLEQPHPGRALTSAVTIALSYIGGGFIPLSPYILISHASEALPYSVIVTLLALGVFGYIKGRFTGTRPWLAAFQTMLIGGLAASAAFGIAWLIDKK